MIEAGFAKEQRCEARQFRTVPVPGDRPRAFRRVFVGALALTHYSNPPTPLVSLSFLVANDIILLPGDAIRSTVI